MWHSLYVTSSSRCYNIGAKEVGPDAIENLGYVTYLRFKRMIVLILICYTQPISEPWGYCLPVPFGLLFPLQLIRGRLLPLPFPPLPGTVFVPILPPLDTFPVACLSRTLNGTQSSVRLSNGPLGFPPERRDRVNNGCDLTNKSRVLHHHHLSLCV